jgi:hypothetical protein
MFKTSFKYLIKFSFLAAFLFATRLSFSQEERGFLEFKGEAFLNNKHLPGVQIKVYRNGKVFTQALSSRKGKFELKLEYFHKYKIELFSEGCYKMFIEVDTDIPGEILPHWATFYLKVPFFENSDTSINPNLFKQSITRVAFDKKLKKYIDLNQFNTDSPANVNLSLITPKKITETPQKLNTVEKKELLKLDAKQNVIIKRKEESHLIFKVNSSKKTEIKTEPFRLGWKGAIERNSNQERSFIMKQEGELNTAIMELETAKIMGKKQLLRKNPSAQIRIDKSEKASLFEKENTIKVYTSEILLYNFKKIEHSIKGDSYYINDKEVSSIEFYLKLKQFVK